MLKIHSYESMGTLDGPGLRFVIFLQGCNFRCLYCANPDTIEFKGAKEISDDEIFCMVSDMKPFFGRKGGVTFSGGEPTLQAKELLPLVERFKKAGIHTCIDTNGSIWNEDVEKLYQAVDLVLLDVKQIDASKHLSLTAKSNEQTLLTAKWMEDNAHPFWLRYVLVPGLSNDPGDISKLGESLGGYKMIERVEVLPYHRLGVHKYEARGLEYKLPEIKENSKEELAETACLMGKYFNCVVIN